MNPARSLPKPPRTYSKHGLTTLKRAVNGLGGRTIDMRTTLGKALAQWRADLVADLGGRDAISTQQAAVIDLAVKTKLLLDSIDAWLLTQPVSLVDRRRRALIPVVRERQQLTIWASSPGRFWERSTFDGRIPARRASGRCHRSPFSTVPAGLSARCPSSDRPCLGAVTLSHRRAEVSAAYR